MKIKDYALKAKKDIEQGNHESVKEWAEANYSAEKASYLTNEIVRQYGERAEGR